MNISFAFNFIGSIPCLMGYLNYGLGKIFNLGTGGPVYMIWGFIVCSIMTYINALNLAEISSAYP
jgi:amino acid permease